MDKQAVAKWRLYALVNKGHEAARTLGRLGRLPSDTYSYYGANYADNVAGAAATRDAIRSYLQNNPALARKMGRFLRENPSLKRPGRSGYSIFGERSRPTWGYGGMAQGPGGATPMYNSIEEFSPYMRNLESVGIVKSVPTPHEPYRKEFFQVPPGAVTMPQGSIDFAKAIPTGVPLSLNTEVNMAVGRHMLFNRYGTPSAASGPKVKLTDFSNNGSQSLESGLGQTVQLRGPAYNKLNDTVYMPNVSGMHNMKKGPSYDKLVGRDVMLEPHNAMRAIFEHEWAGHGMLHRENADYLSRLARKSSLLINRALKDTPYKYKGNGGVTLGEFMANYHAANPGSVIRERTLDMFGRRRARNGFIRAFDNNMKGMDPDVVARTKSGLQQVWDNYGAINADNGNSWIRSLLGSTPGGRPRDIRVIHMPR